MSKRQTRSATRAAKRAADYDDWQYKMMFILKLVVLNGYDIAKSCVGLCRETWSMPAGLSDEESKLVRADNVFWQNIINEKKSSCYWQGYTRLHWAVREGVREDNMTDRVIQLVKWGANIEECCYYGTPLMMAAYYEQLETLRALLKLGANVNSGYNFGIGRTVLLTSCSFNSVTVVKELLAAGADVEKTDFNGDFPLFEAAKKGHKTVYSMLLESGADKHRMHSRYNMTPLDMAARHGF